jgi:hypothetical protein
MLPVVANRSNRKRDSDSIIFAFLGEPKLRNFGYAPNNSVPRTSKSMKNEKLQFSESEQCLIAAWIGAEKRWPKVRWFSLVGSGTLSLCFAFGAWWFHSFAFDGGSDSVAMRVAILASTSPLLWGGLVISLGWFGLTVSRWKTGNMERRILLKLLAEHEPIEQVEN